MKKRFGSAAAAVLHEIFYEGAACCLIAVAVSMFLAPNRIVTGGVTGLATILYQLFSVPVGVSSLLINVPLIAVGFFRLGRRFLLHTLRVVVICSVLTDLAAAYLPAYRSEPVLAALFGGALMGAGLGMIFQRGASTGGSDILVKLLRLRFPHLSFGSLMVATDVLVIGGAALLFWDLDLLILGTLQMIVAGFATDRVIFGSDERKMALIVTQKPQALSSAICTELDRGVTVFETSGGFTGEKNNVLMCVVEPRELTRLKGMVWETDPKAFLVITQVVETLGNGFKPMGED